MYKMPVTVEVDEEMLVLDEVLISDSKVHRPRSSSVGDVRIDRVLVIG